jgi:hypothetical protein
LTQTAVNLSSEPCRIGSCRLLSFLSLFGFAAVAGHAATEEDRFQRAVNYVFTGRTVSANGPQIVDRKSCVVLVPEPKFNRYARYYLSRFKMDTARISKKYAGSQTLYELEVEGDGVIFEYLKPDKVTVDYGFRSAHIPLPGDPEQTEKALALVFKQYCKPENPRGPFRTIFRGVRGWTSMTLNAEGGGRGPIRWPSLRLSWRHLHFMPGTDLSKSLQIPIFNQKLVSPRE